MFSSVSGFHHRGGYPYETGLDTPIPNFITLYISFKIPAGSGQGAGRSGRALPSAQLSAGRQQVPLSSRKRAHYNRVIIADHSRRLKVFFSPLRQVFPRQVPFFPADRPVFPRRTILRLTNGSLTPPAFVFRKKASSRQRWRT